MLKKTFLIVFVAGFILAGSGARVCGQSLEEESSPVHQEEILSEGSAAMELSWPQHDEAVFPTSLDQPSDHVNDVEHSSPSEDSVSDHPAPAATAISPGESMIQPVEIDGDRVEFLQEENKVIISGHVSITKGTTTLRCDHAEYWHERQFAVAQGNVVLAHPSGEIRGEALTFNFQTMTGDFQNATITADPYYGRADTISKLGENHIEMARGYVTSCDLDKPHYRVHSTKIDVYPQDKVQAKSVRMVVGQIPLFYLPQFTQVLSDHKPRVIYTPGYKKEWGLFLLTAWRYYFNEHFKGLLHFDLRERKDVAVGADLNYKISGFGEGVIKTYYMNERTIQAKRWYEERQEPTIEKERFKGEWRHKWRIDESSQAVWEYYKLSDSDFLKDYFEREHDRNPNPATFFLYTKNFRNGTLSFRTDKRVNRFTSTVERLPEIGYTLSNQRLGHTNFYVQSNNLYSNLSYPDASPSARRAQTMRLDSDNQLSYPLKVSFIDLTPFVGQRETFYSKTKETSRYNVVRSVFKTGATLSTKFYRTFDATADGLGIQIERLRHIIKPEILYNYVHEPTIPSSKLDLFDSAIDAITRGHKLEFSLENRFQTKRKDRTVDFLRIVGKTDFLLKEDAGRGGFNTVSSDIEFRPNDLLTFYSDTSYDAQEARLISANFEMYVNQGKRWWLSLGKRYQADLNDQVTAEIGWKLNPKWQFRFYERFDVGGDGQQEQQYIVTRDLHCWEMDLAFNHRKTQGSEIWIVFRMKAFPDMSIDFINTSFNKRKTGSAQKEGF